MMNSMCDLLIIIHILVSQSTMRLEIGVIAEIVCIC